MTRLSRRRGRLGTTALAGWLFADFLLVLALVAMGDQADPLADRRPAPRPTPTHSAKPRPKPTPTGPRSVSRTRYKFSVAGSDNASLERQIVTATRARAGQEAAFVLTFGGTQAGTAYARKVNVLLHRARPAMFNQDTATEDFLQLDAEADTASVWVYFYTAPR
ncbi:hypothetical protein ACFO3J_15185 [Streptomyces polygonati]|uniref:Secreted protein n=1 Tax=Streptomyces polygonati TaxID=1617087 RepID=A0ABV8HLB1_9ACTN